MGAFKVTLREGSGPDKVVVLVLVLRQQPDQVCSLTALPRCTNRFIDGSVEALAEFLTEEIQPDLKTRYKTSNDAIYC